MEHGHAINFSPLLFPAFLISLLIILKLAKFTKFKLVTILLLIVFVFTHVNPDRLVAASHHNLEGKTQDHPCCVPQISNVETPKIVSPKIVFINSEFIVYEEFKSYLLSFSLNNKSPPII